MADLINPHNGRPLERRASQAPQSAVIFRGDFTEEEEKQITDAVNETRGLFVSNALCLLIDRVPEDVIPIYACLSPVVLLFQRIPGGN